MVKIIKIFVVLIFIILCGSLSAQTYDTTHYRIGTESWRDLLGTPRKGVAPLVGAGHIAVWTYNGLRVSYNSGSTWLENLGIGGISHNHPHLSNYKDTVYFSHGSVTTTSQGIYTIVDGGSPNYLTQIYADVTPYSVNTIVGVEKLVGSDSLIAICGDDQGLGNMSTHFRISSDNGNTFGDTTGNLIANYTTPTDRTGTTRNDSTVFAVIYTSGGDDSVHFWGWNRATQSFTDEGVAIAGDGVDSISRAYVPLAIKDTLLCVGLGYPYDAPVYLYYSFKEVGGSWTNSRVSLGTGFATPPQSFMGVAVHYIESTGKTYITYQDYSEATPTTNDSVFIYIRPWNLSTNTLGTPQRVGRNRGTYNDGGWGYSSNGVTPTDHGSVIYLGNEAYDDTDGSYSTYLTVVTITESGSSCTDITHSLANTTVSSTSATITDTHDATSVDSIMFHIGTTTNIADADSTLDLTILSSPYSVDVTSLSPQTQYYYWFRVSHDEGGTDCRDTSSMGTFTTLDLTAPDDYDSFDVLYILNADPDSVSILLGAVDSADFITYEIRWDTLAMPANRASGQQLYQGSAFESDTVKYLINSIVVASLPCWVYFKVYTADEVPNWSTAGVGDSVYFMKYPTSSVNYMSSYLMGLQRK